jgi:enoyl-CoA hydratase/carnithine racemase
MDTKSPSRAATAAASTNISTSSTHHDPEPNAVQIVKTPEGITTITLNRPHRRNAVNGPTARKLRDAFVDFENDDTQKVCVFHGANGIFCAGADLQEIAKSDPKQKKDSTLGSASNTSSNPLLPVQGRENLGPMGPSRMQIRKPVICAVAGHAVAGGLELSLLGDMRVVEEDAIFGVFCRRFGVPLIDGGTVRLQRVIGLGQAMDMILTGRAVSAQEALQMGLANRVVPKGESVNEAIKIAKQLLAFPQACMNADRDSCYYAAYRATSMEDAFGYEFQNGVQVFANEGIQGAGRFTAGVGRHGRFETVDSKL